jgi:hypothetical protein
VSPEAARITVECPACGHCYEDWALGTPDLDYDPDAGDPGWIQAASAATCPRCGCTASCSGLTAERERWRDM